MTDGPAFFAPAGGVLLPGAHACGPWSPDMLHGRLLAGLAAWAVERDHGGDDLHPVRLTVDLYRAAPIAATTVRTTIVRSGGRVRAADAVVTVGGADVARASCLLLRRSEAPLDDVPVTPVWDAPHPDAVPATAMPVEQHFELRPVSEDPFGGPAPRQVWVRDRRQLVDGVPLTPFVRAALSADFASPLGNFASDGIEYINADLTLHLARLPAGEWIGLSTDDRVAADGVSVVQALFHDVDGPIGWSAACAVRTPRMARAASG